MILGMGLAFVAFRGVGGSWLRTAFGVMVLVLAARELWALYRAKKDAKAVARPIPPLASIAAIFGAGIIHGIYATGGPLLVYAIGREGLDKHAFRSSLSMIWLVLNVFLFGSFVFEGRYDASVGMDLLVLLPTVPLGIVLGEWLHHRVEERKFKITVFSLLIAAAISLLLR
jgi:uncharacterized membrane protein YfcA